MKLQFKRLSDRKPIDIVTYVKDYLKDNPNTNIYVGTDSQIHGRYTDFGIVVALHKGNKRGGHVLYSTDKLPRMSDRFSRLWKELEYSMEVAVFFEDNGIQKPKEIHVDLNPDPKYGSNFVLRSAMGYIESMGYTPKCKPNAWASSYAADKVCK